MPRPAEGYRADAFPEAIEYRDTGCEESPSCLRCPLPRCKYDVPAHERLRVRSRALATTARAMKGSGANVDEIAAAIGKSRRTVFRLLKEEK